MMRVLCTSLFQRAVCLPTPCVINRHHIYLPRASSTHVFSRRAFYHHFQPKSAVLRLYSLQIHRTVGIVVVSTYPVRYQPTWSATAPITLKISGFKPSVHSKLPPCGYRSPVYLPRALSTHIFVRVVYAAKCVAISIKAINFTASKLCFCTFSVASSTITPPFSDATRILQVDGARGFVAVRRKRRNI